MSSLTENTEKSTHYLSVEKNDAGLRLDKFLAMKLPEISRSRVHNLLEKGAIKKNNAVVSERNQKVKANEVYEVVIPGLEPSSLLPKKIPLNIVFEDKDLLVIDKSAGLTVHPGAGTGDDTMVNALLAHCGGSLSGIGGVERPGIVHRLDRDTSGLLVVAKNDAAHKNLTEQIKARELKRTYIAVIWGILSPQSGRIEANIGRSPRNRKKMAVFKTAGKPAITHYKTLEVFGNGIASLVECRLETGRTHQIRVHLTHKGNSLVGDKVYGNPKRKIPASTPEKVKKFIHEFPRQALHSISIGFIHPKKAKYIELESKIPQDIKTLIKHLKGIENF